MEEEKQTSSQAPKKKYSIFQIVSVVLIALLAVAIIVQIAVIINLKNRTDDLQNKLDNLPTESVEDEYYEDCQTMYIKSIEKTEI